MAKFTWSCSQASQFYYHLHTVIVELVSEYMCLIATFTYAIRWWAGLFFLIDIEMKGKTCWDGFKYRAYVFLTAT